MPKGMFTQGVCVLLERVPSLDELEAALVGFDIRKRVERGDWTMGGPSLVIVYRLESNGLVSVDIVDRPWPDHMGDTKKQAKIFGAWSMGYFGPFTYPGGLQRASQQCRAWEPGKTIADRHKAFIRIRTSYAFGAGDDDPIIPSDYEALPELEFVTKLATSVLNVPGALCYFNPNGEVLRDKAGLCETSDFGMEHRLPPLDAWSNIRMFNINADWSLVDTVGNGQLDIPDAEACFHSQSYDFNQVDNFLRNVSLYLLKNGEIIKDGNTMDGPGGVRWQVHQFDNGLCDPPRRVLRWLPMDDHPIPPEIAMDEDAG
jgi:hypothetical protein